MNQSSSSSSFPRNPIVSNRARAKWTRIPTSCEDCRRRHAKCDNTRPICKRCEKEGLNCKYLADNDSPAFFASASPGSPSPPVLSSLSIPPIELIRLPDLPPSSAALSPPNAFSLPDISSSLNEEDPSPTPEEPASPRVPPRSSARESWKSRLDSCTANVDSLCRQAAAGNHPGNEALFRQQRLLYELRAETSPNNEDVFYASPFDYGEKKTLIQRIKRELARLSLAELPSDSLVASDYSEPAVKVVLSHQRLPVIFYHKEQKPELGINLFTAELLTPPGVQIVGEINWEVRVILFEEAFAEYEGVYLEKDEEDNGAEPPSGPALKKRKRETPFQSDWRSIPLAGNRAAFDFSPKQGASNRILVCRVSATAKLSSWPEPVTAVSEYSEPFGIITNQSQFAKVASSLLYRYIKRDRGTSFWRMNMITRFLFAVTGQLFCVEEPVDREVAASQPDRPRMRFGERAVKRPLLESEAKYIETKLGVDRTLVADVDNEKINGFFWFASGVIDLIRLEGFSEDWMRYRIAPIAPVDEQEARMNAEPAKRAGVFQIRFLSPEEILMMNTSVSASGEMVKDERLIGLVVDFWDGGGALRSYVFYEKPLEPQHFWLADPNLRELLHGNGKIVGARSEQDEKFVKKKKIKERIQRAGLTPAPLY